MAAEPEWRRVLHLMLRESFRELWPNIGSGDERARARHVQLGRLAAAALSIPGFLAGGWALNALLPTYRWESRDPALWLAFKWAGIGLPACLVAIGIWIRTARLFRTGVEEIDIILLCGIVFALGVSVLGVAALAAGMAAAGSIGGR